MLTSFSKLRAAIGAAFSLAAMTVFLGGCFDENHYAHSDFITRQAGDGMAVNNVAQTIDPWPKEAKNRKLDANGKRVGVAIQRYEQNKSIPPKGLSTSTISGQSGPGAQSSTSIQN